MLSYVVFTGPAHDHAGHPIVRKDLITACAKAQIEVWNKVAPGCVLVAARDDTVKAKAAKQMGVTVMPYVKFLAVLNCMGCPVVASGVAPDPYCDDTNEVPDFTKGPLGLL